MDKRIADFRKADLAAKELLSPAAIEDLRSKAQAYRSGAIATPGLTETLEATLDDDEDASTSHLVVADSAGNIVCLTQSLSFHFGASVVSAGTGILLNNSMNNFNIENQRSVNAIQPGKHPRSTVAPVIVERDGKVEFAFGIPGGQRIPTTTIQLLMDVLVAEESLPTALERWRFHLRRPVEKGQAANILDFEEDAPDYLLSRLESRGWRPLEVTRDGTYFGGGNGVQYLSDGRLLAVADLRCANAAGGK